MSKDELVPFKTAAEALAKLCREGHSGAMYMYTDQGHGVIFSIQGGGIVDIFFRNLRGAAALQEIRNIERAKFFFKGDSQASGGSGARGELSNEQVFEQMGMSYDAGPSADLKKILIVEDSGLARKVLVESLSSQGYYVIEAVDGEDALAQLAQITPDLVLLDLILPKKDGYEVLSEMKRSEKTENIPVIVLTSRDTLFDKLKGKMSGTDEYLTKPVDPVKLKEKLNKYLGT